MSDPLHDVFEVLEPPPGGLAELRHRVRGERTPRKAWVGGLAMAAAAAVVLVVALPRGPAPGDQLAARLACDDPTLAALICDRAVPGARVSPGHHDRLALAPVPTADERVLLFRVASNSTPLRSEDVPKVVMGATDAE